jgi:hypothetical protein
VPQLGLHLRGVRLVLAMRLEAATEHLESGMERNAKLLRNWIQAQAQPIVRVNWGGEGLARARLHLRAQRCAAQMADNAGVRALNVDALFGMPTQVPAGIVTEMRKQRMGAGLGFLSVEDVFGLVVFLPDGVVAIDGDGAKGIAVCRDAVTKH